MMQIFTPTFSAQLEAAAGDRREPLLKQAILDRQAAMPERVRNSALALTDDADAMRLARELTDFRMPLMDGSSIAMGLPYDWYYGVNDGHLGGAAPAYIVPRIAFSGTLARAYLRTGDALFARTLHAYIMDYVGRYWTDSTVLPSRDNWLCTACRCGTWYDERFGGIFNAMRHPGLLEPFSFSDLLDVFRAIENMMIGLIPNLALGSNWRVHQLANIFTQGYAYPFLRHSSDWLALACEGLNEEFAVQFHRDGSHEELCVEYGSGTWVVFTHFFALAQTDPAIGLRFDADGMRRSLEYYLSARKPFGRLAAIGDAYNCRSQEALDPDSAPFPSGRAPNWDRCLRTGAKNLDHPHLNFPETSFILRGTPQPEWSSRFHPVSGHLFMRDGWQTDSLYANMNLGWYANCHCHYGLLGVEFSGFGREFIVDAGCSALDPRPINANLARTRGHNTLSVDGLDQQVAVPVQPSRIFIGRDYDFAVAVYRGGYTMGNPYGPGCTSAGRFDNCFSGSHFRHLLFVKGGYWVLLDALSTLPGHRAETRLHFMPNHIRNIPGGGYCTGWEQANLALLPLHWEGWEHAIFQGCQDPIEGWLPAPGGELIPAPVYRAVRATDASPVWHGSLLFPFREAKMPALDIRPLPVGPTGFGYRITSGDTIDYLFISNSWQPGDIVMDPIATNAPLLHLRTVKGRPVGGFACEGTYLVVSGRDVFRAPGSMLAREFKFGPDGDVMIRVDNPRWRKGD